MLQISKRKENTITSFSLGPFQKKNANDLKIL